jgi:3-hydroxybutyryl-CoA dehydrogenase
MQNFKENNHVFITGSGRLSASLCVCFLQAQYEVTMVTGDEQQTQSLIQQHIKDIKDFKGESINEHKLEIKDNIEAAAGCSIVIAITNENLEEKLTLLRKLENNVHPEVLIAINTESIALSALQASALYPARIIGANWVEPVHNTYFLEIIANTQTDPVLLEYFYQSAKESWNKDPYIIKGNYGIRSRMMCALIREAFYLVENGYVSVEDIDRACRNDAGYYFPFAGNFRYMDLMGGYMYGIVMQDLNPDLSKYTHLPQFSNDLLREGAKGMQNDKGFYSYAPGETQAWDTAFRKFSYQVREIISKYAYLHQKEINSLKLKTVE